MESLDAAAIRHGTDKSSLGHDYCDHYQHHLGSPRSILEIGVATGASLRMWAEHYPHARVMGVDVTFAHVEGAVGEIHLGDATDPETFRGWLPESVDVIVDDGSHQAPDVIASFALLWPRVPIGGWYVIEDLACAFTAGFGGDLTGGPVMGLVASLAADAVQSRVEMHLYEEIVFVRRLV